MIASEPIFFRNADAVHKWLTKTTPSQRLQVGFLKKRLRQTDVTYCRSGGALCFGWIDGIRKSVG